MFDLRALLAIDQHVAVRDPHAAGIFGLDLHRLRIGADQRDVAAVDRALA